jgi:histidine triad (HIT) family protein
MQINCIFCKIIDKSVPATIIAESEKVLVIQDIAPKAPIHYLIIPKIHHSNIASINLSNSTVPFDLFEMAQKLSCIDAQHAEYRLVINEGKNAGQTVFHLHLHFLSGQLLEF